MEIFRFDQGVGKKVTHFQSDFVMSRIIKTENPAQISCMHLEAKGLIGLHEATVSQLLLIVEGEGWVRSNGSSLINVKKGQAVYWDQGENHETGTETGMTAIVIESECLSPRDFMAIRDEG
ncbi:cupin [Salipaludibacillus keqinensis]|uniref:Cupin n=1 Tax=Salipaludibacillus keqinensis TaxID=2045207 RepID=A0A323TE16_9BACI|nr:cupin [Salipaludibacillus keqinensis]PYZ93361.1 cupin [Salipaludibacillus keqinensis]